jgi:hypothetical protein
MDDMVICQMRLRRVSEDTRVGLPASLDTATDFAGLVPNWMVICSRICCRIFSG